MPLFLTSQIGGTTLILSGAILLSAPGIDFPARPAMPLNPAAQTTALIPPVGYRALTQNPAPTPPVGYRAQEDPPLLPPALVVSLARVSDVAGHTLTLTLPNNFAPIFYTLNGTVPDETKTRYSLPIRVQGNPGQNFTLKYKAFAIDGSGYVNSVVYTLALQIPQKPYLTFDVTIGPGALERTVAIISSIVGAFEVHYTIDNATPTLSSATYTTPFSVTGTPAGQVRVKAIAFPTSPLGATGGILQSDLEAVLLLF